MGTVCLRVQSNSQPWISDKLEDDRRPETDHRRRFFSLTLLVPMAAIINSNSFILTTAPNARRSFKSHRRQFAVYSKSSGTLPPFRLGKASNESPSSDDAPAEDSANSNPFRFAFGKVPDVKSLIQVVSEPSSGLSFGNGRRKDSNTVFVAGATGQAGIRLAQTLLREGFSVRAGVPELGAAQELARLAAKYKVSLVWILYLGMEDMRIWLFSELILLLLNLVVKYLIRMNFASENGRCEDSIAL